LLRKPEQKTSLSVANLTNVEGWRSIENGNICGLIGRYIRGLEERGIVKQVGTHPYGYASWKLVTTKDFRVEFEAPNVSQKDY